MTEECKESSYEINRLIPYLCCRNASEAVEFYQKAFGAEPMNIQKLPNGRLLHGALKINGGILFLGDEFPEHGALSPQSLNGTPVTIHLIVPDCDASFKRAVDAGCTVRMPLEDMFWGDRYGLVVDPFGHNWSIATPIRKVSSEEIAKAVASNPM